MATHPDPALVAAFEQACRDAQVPATRIPAEASIKQLTRRPDAIPIALAVAQHTALPVARFHAAVTLRTAAIQAWASLTPPQRYGPSSLRYWLVNYVVATPSLNPFERKALLRTAAVFTRRAYLEEPADDRDRFFTLVCETAANPNPAAAHATMAASELIELVAEEFMVPNVSENAPAMQRQLLVQARAQFAAPQGDLLRLLRAATASLSVVLTVPGHPSMGSPEFDARVLPVLGTILRVLATDLSQIQLNPTAEAPLDLYAEATSGSESLEAVVISAFAGSEWQGVIDQLPAILRLCLLVTGMHSTVPNPDIEPKTIPKATQIVTAVSAVSQRSYRTVEDAERLLRSLLDGINKQEWSSSQLGIMRLAYAEVWRRISCAHGLVTVQKLGTGYIASFTKDTCQELDSAAVSLARPDADEEDVFSSDVADMLLETWANIALQGDDGIKTTEHPLAGPIGEVVYHFTKIWLKSSLENEPGADLSGVEDADAEEDLGFEDSSVLDARLSAAAVLLRFVLNKMAPAIAESLVHLADKVFQWSSMQTRRTTLPLDVFQEDLYFLIRLTAGVLADEAKGEHPTVPIQFLSAVPINGHGKPPLNAKILLSALFDVAQKESHLLETRGTHCEEASPRVGSAILDSLTRVTRTYLVPVSLDADSTRSAFEVIGGVGLATTGRSGCLKKALEGISRRGFESDVAESGATLLSALAAGAANYRDIRDSEIWHSLLQAGAGAYQNLPATAVKLVGKCLTKVMGDIVAERLLVPAYNSLQSLIAAGEQDPDAAERVIATVNLLRGAAICESIGPRTREALLLSLRAPDGVAATCAKAFGRTRPDVGRSLINLANDIVTSCLVHLSKEDSLDLVTNAITIVKLHTGVVVRFVSETATDEVGSDVEEIIALLSSILDEETDFDVSEACYVGLSTLFPILTEDILAVPSVHAGFFGFTTRLVIQHPEWLIRLPPDLCGNILHLIELQRMSVDIASEMRSLEAIASLARSRSRNPEHGPASSVVDAALLRFLRLIFMGVASGGAHTDNMDAAADALLALMHVRQDGQSSAFEEIGQELLSQGGNNATLRSAIQELGQSAAQAGSAHGLNGSGNVHPNSTTNRPAELQASKSFRESVAMFSNIANKCLLSIAVGTGFSFEQP